MNQYDPTFETKVEHDEYELKLEELRKEYPECVECKYFPSCRRLEIDGVFIGEDKKCEE